MKYPELKEDAIAFEMGEYVDENDDDAAYGTIEYKGRTYMAYAGLEGKLKTKDIKECIGYIVQNKEIQRLVGSEDKDTRVYTLSADPENNFLVVNYSESSIMNQPMFWRAMDTKGKNIEIPSYIAKVDGTFWE